MMEMIGTLITALGGIACFAWACATTPQTATCPTGWWIPEGVRRTGDFVCRPSPVGDTQRTPAGILVDHSVQPAGELRRHVTCGARAVPIIISDGRTVSCR